MFHIITIIIFTQLLKLLKYYHFFTCRYEKICVWKKLWVNNFQSTEGKFNRQRGKIKRDIEWHFSWNFFLIAFAYFWVTYAIIVDINFCDISWILLPSVLAFSLCSFSVRIKIIGIANESWQEAHTDTHTHKCIQLHSHSFWNKLLALAPKSN